MREMSQIANDNIRQQYIVSEMMSLLAFLERTAILNKPFVKHVTLNLTLLTPTPLVTNL